MVRVVDSAIAPAQQLMDRDAQLLARMGESAEPILHHYEWQGPSATYGLFAKLDQLLDLHAADQLGLSLAKRPTGGGVIFHLTDLAFSLLIPASHPLFSSHTMTNYATVNNMVITVVEQFLGRGHHPQLLPQEPVPADPACAHFCMAKPTKYDVVINGLKVGGAAQRRTRAGLLHQGTISLAPTPDEILEQVLLPETRVRQAMQANSGYLLGNRDVQPAELAEARHSIRALLEQALHTLSS